MLELAPAGEGAEGARARIREVFGAELARHLVALPPSGDAGHETVRSAVAGTGGHATLIRAPEAVRAAVPVFHPQPEPLARLTPRVKNGFDPRGILNPGRMYPGL